MKFSIPEPNVLRHARNAYKIHDNEEIRKQFKQASMPDLTDSIACLKASYPMSAAFGAEITLFVSLITVLYKIGQTDLIIYTTIAFFVIFLVLNIIISLNLSQDKYLLEIAESERKERSTNA